MQYTLNILNILRVHRQESSTKASMSTGTAPSLSAKQLMKAAASSSSSSSSSSISSSSSKTSKKDKDKASDSAKAPPPPSSSSSSLGESLTSGPGKY